MRTLNEILDESARIYLDKPALILPDGTEITYRKLCNEVSTTAQMLNLKIGEPVILSLPNSFDFIVTSLAVLKAGGVLIPLSPASKPQEIERIIKASGARRILLWHKQLELLPKPLFSPSYAISELNPRVINFSLNAPIKRLPFENLAVLMFTTGTTGQPKAVPLLHKGFLEVFRKCERIIPDPSLKVFSSFLPTYHIFGFTFNFLAPLYFGATILVSEAFSLSGLERISEQLIRYNATLITAVPLMFQAFATALQKTKANLNPKAICINGGDYLPPSIWELFKSVTGHTIKPGYGLTETYSLVSVRSLTEAYDESLPTSCVGKPILKTRIIRLRAEGESYKTPWFPLAPNEDGEICFSTKEANVIKKYLDDEEANKYYFQGEWFATGDIGHLDSEGNLYVVDRVKDIIIVAGGNIYPREIEDILKSHPAVLESAVIGVSDPKRGEKICAYVVLKDEEKAVSKEELRAFVRENLSDNKVPHQIIFAKELPKVGIKVDKKALKGLAKQELVL